MTKEQTITIHYDKPPRESTPTLTSLEAYNATLQTWVREYAHVVYAYWGNTYTAWYDPQVAEPMEGEEYLVKKSGYSRNSWFVCDSDGRGVATNIPTSKAAQAIADIYKRAAKGDEV